MKIKKNGKTINLTEGEIKILSKRLLKEQEELDVWKWKENIDWDNNELLPSGTFTTLNEGGRKYVVISYEDTHYPNGVKIKIPVE